MKYHQRRPAAAVGYGAGRLAGGSEGAARERAARDWMATEQIRRPEGFVQLFAPALAIVGADL